MAKEIEILRSVDPEVASAIEKELDRQRTTLELIASENFTSPAVLAAQGSILTNKYAEGLPGRRYYGGCEFVDIVEELARARAKELFGAEHANVQPHSGAQANMAVYFAALEPGDRVMGLDLCHGGHLTHGHRANFSGQLYDIVSYGVSRDSEVFDYEEIERKAKEVRPKMIVAGASAYPRTIDFSKFGEIAREVGASLFVDMAHIAGLVAVGLHPTPVSHSDYVTTTTHKTLRGPRAGMILCRREYAREIDHAVFPGVQGGPLMHAIAGKAVALKLASTPGFAEYQRRVVDNAKVLAEALQADGLRLVAGGTDTHCILVDLTPKGITGRQAEEALEASGITVNKNAIPFDALPPTEASGIRIGTPAVTTRGMGTREMGMIADLIAEILNEPENAGARKRVREKVCRLCEEFPVYEELDYSPAEEAVPS